MFRKFTIVILIIAAIGLVTGIIIADSKPSDSYEAMSQNADASPTQENLPFAEMTIPFLRNRQYSSSIQEQVLYAEAETYDSYLTSYTSDGLKINALLTKPSGEMPEGGWPGIVFIHGFIPPATYVTEQKYEAYVDYLARNGFVVFKIDLRGHGNSEGEAGGAYYSSDYIIDTLNAHAALAASDFVNPRKIGLWGHSMAGNVVLRSMAAKPEIPAAVVWAGAVFNYQDFRELGISDNSYRPPSSPSTRLRRRQELFDAHGQFDPASPFWKLVDQSNYLTDLKGAIQIHHAVDDDVVDVNYSRNLNTRLDQTNAAHEYFEYQTGGHNINGSSFSSAMSRTVEFFEEYLNK